MKMKILENLKHVFQKRSYPNLIDTLPSGPLLKSEVNRIYPSLDSNIQARYNFTSVKVIAERQKDSLNYNIKAVCIDHTNSTSLNIPICLNVSLSRVIELLQNYDEFHALHQLKGIDPKQHKSYIKQKIFPQRGENNILTVGQKRAVKSALKHQTFPN